MENRRFIIGLIFFLLGSVATAMNLDWFITNSTFDWLRVVLLIGAAGCAIHGYFLIKPTI